MSDIDAEDAEDEIAPRRHQTRKGESVVGNIVEGVLTYLAPATIYTPATFLMVFAMGDAQTAAQTVWTLVTWIIINGITTVLFGIGAGVGTESKFSSRPQRLFLAFIAALTPLLLPIIMVVRAGDGGYAPSGLDWLIAVLGFIPMAVFGCFLYVMHTAVRRVREVSRE